MVRLKVTLRERVIISVLSFNSSMVRLKAGAYQKIPMPITRFNSSMVRLKDYVILLHCFVCFQFKYGSIKSLTVVSVSGLI